MKVNSRVGMIFVLSLAIVLHGAAWGQPNVREISLKPGESVELGPVYWIRTTDCRSLLMAFGGVDMLEGPPGLALTIKEQEVVPRQEMCRNTKVPGGVLIVTATEIQTKISGLLKIRVRYNTNEGRTESTHIVKVNLYPSSLAPTAIVSQSTAAPRSVQRPAPMVGDTWTFRRVDGWNGAIGQPIVETVINQGDEEIVIQRGGVQHAYDRDWNALAAIQDGKRSKSRSYGGTLSFPLTIGRTWTKTAEFSNAAGEQLSYTPNAEVIAWESIALPAGTFDAFRVKANGIYTGSTATNSQFQGAFDETYWYSPAVQRIVRYEFRNSGTTRFIIELTEFRLVDR